MERTRSKFFKEPEATYKKGTVHRMSFDRKHFSKEKGFFEADATIGKCRYGVIISDTKQNKVGCTVMPIKTDRGSNQFSYEIYLPICVVDDVPGLVCISQCTYLPNECIETKSFGELKDSVVDDIYELLDVQLGRKSFDELHLSDASVEDIKAFSEPKEPVRKINDAELPYFNSFNQGELTISEISEMLSVAPFKIAEISEDNGIHLFRNCESVSRKVGEFIKKNYNKATAPGEKYVKIKLEEFYENLNNWLALNMYMPIERENLASILTASNYRVLTWMREEYILGLINKKDKFGLDFIKLPQRNMMEKYNLSAGEYDNVRICMRKEPAYAAIYEYRNTTKPVSQILKTYNISSSSFYYNLEKFGIAKRG